MDGILTDTAIRQAIDEGGIEIDPFNEVHLNPNSVDLTLGDEVCVYDRWVETFPYEPREDGRYFEKTGKCLDVKEEPRVSRFKIDHDAGWILKPGILYLMHTQERVCSRRYVPVLDGKSSIARLGITIHITAGYGDVNFDGQYTLEVTTQHMVRIYPGMRICQIRFHTLAGEVQRPYNEVGHYVGDAARGAIPSKAWRQLQEMTGKV
jgi:dCTP deaminase